MILLDTNVLSEAMNPRPSLVVLRWLAAQERDTIFTTTVTQAEILYGVEVLAPGRRRTHLSMAAEKIFSEEFQGRILPFDESAAQAFAKIVTARVSTGRPISQFDAMIAAIAHSCGASIATRNVADFEHCGIHVINPWSE